MLSSIIQIHEAFFRKIGNLKTGSEMLPNRVFRVKFEGG